MNQNVQRLMPLLDDLCGNAPDAYNTIAAAIEKAHVAMTDALRKTVAVQLDARTVAALGLSRADVATMTARADAQKRQAAAVGALSKDQQKALRSFFPDAGDQARFLASREGTP